MLSSTGQHVFNQRESFVDKPEGYPSESWRSPDSYGHRFRYHTSPEVLHGCDGTVSLYVLTAHGTSVTVVFWARRGKFICHGVSSTLHAYSGTYATSKLISTGEGYQADSPFHRMIGTSMENHLCREVPFYLTTSFSRPPQSLVDCYTPRPRSPDPLARHQRLPTSSHLAASC
jgi:hypothetical protein